MPRDMSHEKMDAFTQEEDETFIEIIKDHPLIYDMNHEYHKDQRVRDKIWIEIADKLNKNVAYCRKHWRILRDGYSRFKRKSKTGYSSKHSKYKVKWHIYDKLSFLDPFLNSTYTGGEEVTLEAESQDDISQTAFEDPLCFPYVQIEEKEEEKPKMETQRVVRCRRNFKRPRPLVRRDELFDKIKKIDITNGLLLKAVAGKQSDEYDLDSFAAHMQAVLKKLPPMLKVRAKQELFAVLSKYEMAAIEDGLTSYSRPLESPPTLHPGFLKVEAMEESQDD